MDKKKLSTFSYKLVQISPIMILVNSGAFLSISSCFCELTEPIFVMIPYIYSNGSAPQQREGLWVCASSEYENEISFTCKLNLFSYEWLCTRPCFEREALGNSEMVYCLHKWGLSLAFYPRVVFFHN